MASSQDLKEVLKESLENRGALSEIKARIRAEVFAALDDQTEKPQISNENVLIFELIREFLDYNYCKYTSTVLISGDCFTMDYSKLKRLFVSHLEHLNRIYSEISRTAVSVPRARDQVISDSGLLTLGPETGLPKAPLDREFLRNELNIVEDAPSRSVPLLYSLVSNFKDSNASRRVPANLSSFNGNQKESKMLDDLNGGENRNPEAVIVRGGRS